MYYSEIIDNKGLMNSTINGLSPAVLFFFALGLLNSDYVIKAKKKSLTKRHCKLLWFFCGKISLYFYLFQPLIY